VIEPLVIEAELYDELASCRPKDEGRCFVLEDDSLLSLPELPGFGQWRKQLNVANREHAGRVFAVDSRGQILTVDEDPRVGIAVQRPVVRGPERTATAGHPGPRQRLSPLAASL
jgi:hypothetical protein